MYRRIFISLTLILSSIQGLSSEYMDSLANVLETSELKSDFHFVDSIIDLSEVEQNTLSRKNLVFIATARTKQLGYEYYYGKFLLRKSVIETIHGNYGIAMSEAKESLKVLSKQNSFHTNSCYNSIAGMLSYQGDSATAIACMNKAFAICEIFPDHPKYEHGISNNNLMLGNIYLTHGDLEKGKKHTELALALAEKNDLYSSEIYANLNLSKIPLANGDFEACLAYQRKALALSQKHNAFNLEALSVIKIAGTYYASGEYDLALETYKKGEELAIKQSLSDRLLVIYKNTYELYLLKHNMTMASNYQGKYISLYEKQKKKEKEEQLVLLQVRFKLNEKNAQINALAVDKEHQEEQNMLLQIMVIIAITGFCLLIVIVILFLNRNRLRRKINAERQEKELSRYQMTALKSQMNPHFTFNALNSIQDLILQEKSEESYTYISKFADLVRKTLNHSDQDFIDVSEEIASIEVYLELEQLRFQEDLTITVETNGVSGISIPPLLIQPFIENALKHGLFHKKGAKHLHIDFKLKKDLICTIRDNGIGRAAAGKIQIRRSKEHTSFAVKSIEGRFKLLRKIYGKSVGVVYIDLDSDSDTTGTTVVISLPFKTT